MTEAVLPSKKLTFGEGGSARSDKSALSAWSLEADLAACCAFPTGLPFLNGAMAGLTKIKERSGGSAKVSTRY